MKYDVLGVGHAIVDVLAFVDEEFLQNNNLAKGIMTLVDSKRSAEIYAQLGQTTEISGGSAANTVAGITSLGGTAAYIGKVDNDELGKVFKRDMNGVGVAFDSPITTVGEATGKCLVLITSDAERTMLTSLGASHNLSMNYVDAALIKDSRVTYIEGYMWDDEGSISVIQKIIQIAKAAGNKVAFSLSDPFCVSRHRDAFLKLLPDVDILFANSDETKMLFDADLDESLQMLQGKSEISVVTDGINGAYVVSSTGRIHVETTPVSHLVDTTGAGDLFASGFLFGYAQGRSLEECAKLGNFAAGEIIQHRGARPARPLKDVLLTKNVA